MTGTWIYAFHTFLYFDQPWEAETELENNRWKLEMILQNNRWNVRREETTISLPDGRKQILDFRYTCLPWNKDRYSITVLPEMILLEIPVTVPEADRIAAKWEKWLGLSADPVITRFQLTEEERNQPVLLPEMEVLPYRDGIHFKSGLYSPEDLQKPVSPEKAAENVPAARQYTVQTRERKMHLTRRARNYELVIDIQLGHCIEMHRDISLFEDNTPIWEGEILLVGAGFTKVLETQYGAHTDQQGFEAFLADTRERAEKYWQILQREGVTAPDLPEWYR